MATPNLTPNSAQEPQSNAARPQTSLELTAAFFETLEGYDQTVQDLRSINARIAARDENTAHDTEPSSENRPTSMNTNNPSSANTPSQPTSESNEPGNVPQGSTGRKRKAPTDEGNVTQDSAQKRRAPPKTNTTKGKKPVSRTKRGLRPRMEMTQAEKDAEYMETGIAKDERDYDEVPPSGLDEADQALWKKNRSTLIDPKSYVKPQHQNLRSTKDERTRMREVLKKLVAVSDGTITRDSFEVTKNGLSVRRKKPEQGEEAEEGDSGDGEDGKEGEDGEDQQ